VTSALDVSVVVIAKNEQDNIARCLNALASYSDIVVIDDNSTDQTVETSEAHGARILAHQFESFATQRNWALEHAGLTHEWILFLDADEVVTPEFSETLATSVANASHETAGFLICRKTMLLGRWLRFSDGFPVWIMRVVRRGRASFVDSGHGEVPAPSVDGVLNRINDPVIHYPFSKGLNDWFARHNRYSAREAELESVALPTIRFRNLFTRNSATRRQTLRSLARRLPFRPVIRFTYQYIWRRGFLDGSPGFLFSTLMAVYEAMIVAKRREISFRMSEMNIGMKANESHSAVEIAKSTTPCESKSP
jgi:glycosyltransferase involved in cell wall biosynthesis